MGTMRTALALCSALALTLVAGVGAAEEETLDLDGYLARQASTSRMERMILRQGAAKAAPYRALSEFYAFRVPFLCFLHDFGMFFSVSDLASIFDGYFMHFQHPWSCEKTILTLYSLQKTRN